jgi:NAD(P)-dependent dehydrogenase (short-subunit alcohol dehydrogenase family)
VAAQKGGIDISFNLITHGDVRGTPMAEMVVDDYVQPVATAVRTMFLSARAAARHMIPGDGEVILVFGGEGDPPRGQYLGGLQTAFNAMEAMRRQLSSELGPHGIRVVTLRAGGVPESIPEGFAGRDAIVRSIEEVTMLGPPRPSPTWVTRPRSSRPTARTMTAATVNVSCGATID